jgi:hypothetical protein
MEESCPFPECKSCRVLDDCPAPEVANDMLGSPLPPPECPFPMDVMKRTTKKHKIQRLDSQN